MKSNSDKQLRDKLTGVEFPFDPQAWEQMEDMLDKKKKRRGFFWWWTGGIAAALLFAVVGYELGVNSGNKQIVTNNGQKIEVKNEKLNENTSAVSSSNEQQNVNAKEQTVNSQLQIANGKSEKQKEHLRATSSSNEQEGATNNKHIVKEKANGNKANEENPTASIRVNSSDASSSISDVHSKKQKRKQQLLAKANEGGVNTIVSVFEKNLLQQQTHLPASSTTKNLLVKRIEMDVRAGFLESLEDENSFNKKSEESLPKANKKIFNYSLGVAANVTGTMVSDFGFMKFYSQPSFAAGLTHDFLFINRVAITNAFLYSQTGFKIKEPTAPADSSTTTLSYSSAISELQIPIGIKAYPVNKKWFRFSIAAGIINHIKLKEIFTVEKQIYQYQLTPPITSFDNMVTTGNNPFMEGLNKSSNLSDQTRTQGEQGEYFGMGGLRRYYASFYASAGVEFIAKRKYIFFTEPMFYMSLNKIGLQQQRKYNVGVSGGFRYQF